MIGLLALHEAATFTPIPDSFLGEYYYAPSLRYLKLDGIPFPGIPKLLSTTTRPITLTLHDIPYSGQISSGARATCLSVLTSLERLWLEFLSYRSHPSWRSRHPPPPNRAILLVLTSFEFQGVSKYLEDVIACVVAPR